VRFPLEVFKRIREKAGRDFILEMRVSGDEMLPGGMPIEEIAEYCKMVEDYVDIVNVSAGVHEALDTVYRQFAQSGFTPHGVNRYLAEHVKKSGTKMLVSVVGGISTPELAEEILELGQADLIGMARALLADPEFPNKARAGKTDDIIPCLRCCNCLPGAGVRDTVRCAVNAKTGSELHWQTAPRPEGVRRVAVVGGGPAGMRAAITAAERGHEVTLFESSDKLGGILNISEYGDYLKQDMLAFKNYLTAKTLRCVNVKLNTPGTPENVAAIKPDAVIAAVGGTPIVPGIPGAEGANVISGIDAYRNADKTGARVAVIGGGLVGCEAGLFLAEKGRDVTIVEMRDEIGDAVDWRQTRPLVSVIDSNKNIRYLTGVTCKEITNEGIKLIHKDGSEKFVEADTVVAAVGIKPLSSIVDSLRDVAPWFRAVGDCHKPGRIMRATQDGYWAAMDIL
jgi:NADPH-dependent 2,4-dienoyl-CoA reductase/sulfur reductase-like enzyme